MCSNVLKSLKDTGCSYFGKLFGTHVKRYGYLDESQELLQLIIMGFDFKASPGLLHKLNYWGLFCRSNHTPSLKKCYQVRKKDAAGLKSSPTPAPQKKKKNQGLVSESLGHSSFCLLHIFWQVRALFWQVVTQFEGKALTSLSATCCLLGAYSAMPMLVKTCHSKGSRVTFEVIFKNTS